ncbi:hypothetical protein M8J75_008163 [Diaphorina citri]|nr:hypothetical protein M8J75_008163 [Diaphorina citri]
MKYKTSLVFICFLLPYIGLCKKKSKSVSTIIDAKWHLTPIALEISEYLAEDDPSLFWRYVDYINALQPALIDSGTDKDRYERALGEASRILSNSQLNLLKLSLAMHSDSPRVEMYNQIALQRGVKCPVALDVGDALLCTLDSLENTINSYLKKDKSSLVRMDTFRIDHQYPGCDNSSLTLILYGELGTPEFAQFHAVLEKYAKRKEINYIVRHFVKERQPRKVRLSGYGVELQMKSTEYKATDDAAVQDKTGAESVDEDEQEVEGFNFQRLKELYPDQKASLSKFRNHLLESTNEMAPLKVWQFQDLSQQAAQRILDAPVEDQLHTLIHIAQNFPVQARSLVSVKVTPEFRAELKHNQDLYMNTLSLGVSEGAMYVNGLYFDVDLIDMAKLLETVRHELSVMQGLYSIGITDDALQKLLCLDLSPSSKTEYGLDIRDSAVQWINDIEQDKKYSRWSYSLMDLLRPTFPGMLRNIKRNLYSLLIESFYVHSAPLRIGLVFNINPADEVTGLQDAGVAMLNVFNYIGEIKKPHEALAFLTEDAGVAMLNVFNYIGEIKKPHEALAFLTEVYAKVKPQEDVSPEDVINAFAKEYSSVNVDEIFGPDSDYNTGRQLSREFIARTGLVRKTPQLLV